MLMKDLRAKSRPELQELINELKAQLFQLRFQNSTNQLKETHKISVVKKDIAKVFTVLNTQSPEKTPISSRAKAAPATTKKAKPSSLKAKAPLTAKVSKANRAASKPKTASKPKPAAKPKAQPKVKKEVK